MKFLQYLVIIFFTTVLSTKSFSTDSIVYLDINMILANSTAGKNASNDLEAKFKKETIEFNKIGEKLKEDEAGNKITEVRGIRAACKVMKTRFAKPFEGVQLKIPYETGMDPYSGLVDLFEKKGLIVQQGNRLKYITADGTEMLDYRKAWTAEKLDIVMQEVSNQVAIIDDTETNDLEEAVQTQQDGDTDVN